MSETFTGGFEPIPFTLLPKPSTELTRLVELARRETNEVRRRQRLADAVEATFPPEILDAFEQNIQGVTRNPVAVYGLNIATVADAHDIAEGICASRAPKGARDLQVEHEVLKRRWGAQFQRGYIHSDGFHIGIFACPKNDEKAPTRFIDYRAVAREMTEQEQEQIRLGQPKGPGGAGTFKITLRDLVGGTLPWAGYIAPLAAECDEKALAKFAGWRPDIPAILF